jgi:hypothetical protein
MSNNEQPITNAKVRSAAVTVFGVLNCVFGGIWLIFSILTFGLTIAERASIKIDPGAIHFYFFFLIIFGLSIFEITTGIGLLKMTRWARKWSVFFSYSDIVCCFIFFCLNLIAERMQWTSVNEEDGFMDAFGLIISIIYPSLLLIFMKSEKVKQAFEAIEK